MSVAETRVGSAAANPISADEFAHAMRALGRFSKNTAFVCAISGGADSMVLCHLLRNWSGGGQNIIAVTVDHGLRPESAAEARQVHQWMAQSGVAHHILNWVGDKPSSNIQHHARAARYRLLTDFCRNQAVDFLCTAHHQDDQIETFFLRLIRGSGVYGLAAMQARQNSHDLQLLRPLLGFEKSRLLATAHHAGINFINDPSNHDDRFTRVKLRQLQSQFSELGLSPARLIQTIERLQSAKSVLESELQRCFDQSVTWSCSGLCVIDHKMWINFGDEIACRALADALAACGGADYAPRYDSLRDLYRELAEPEKVIKRTLAGCVVESQNGKITIMREHGLITDRLWLQNTPETQIWDGRYDIRFIPKNHLADLSGRRPAIAAIGENGWTELLRKNPELRQLRVPVTAKYALPGLFLQTDGLDELCAAPHLNYWKTAEIKQQWQDLTITFRPHHRGRTFVVHDDVSYDKGKKNC